ncbi:hypothetical protein DSO57_1025653 [Entomophthora muscae]|uniref:Uncharacterized protein n=1 Tax=Entomophthora muscae TaxID=34485 RepID=A0ACC2TPT7_9FUNG|nr:hypothetical protein DSO57_1025653 [Entomophthora muscae]
MRLHNHQRLLGMAIWHLLSCRSLKIVEMILNLTITNDIPDEEDEDDDWDD